MGALINYALTLRGDVVRIGEHECRVVGKFRRARRIAVRRTTGTADERRPRYVEADQFDAAQPVLIRGKGKR